MQKTSAGSRSAGEISRIVQKFTQCAKFRAAQKFAHCANFSSCAKFPCFPFRPRTTPFCIFSNFTPDVITIDMGILVFHFFVRLYIAILCNVERGGEGIDKKTVLCVLDSLPSLLSSPFLSFSRQPNTPLRMKTQGMLS